MATAMDMYAPFDSGPGSNVLESTWRAFMRRQVTTGVARTVLEELGVYADGTGMQVKVRSGEVLIEGHWGQTTGETILPISTADPTDPRKDLVVARCDFVDNAVELDVLTGTPESTPKTPGLTQNTSIWEVPLAVVDVPASDTSIDASQVSDARQWGGSVFPTAPDDFLLWGDKLSSIPRPNCTDEAFQANGNMYFVRMQSQIKQTVSKASLYIISARSGGSTTFDLYRGRTLDDLTFFSFVEGYVTSSTGLTTGTLNVGEVEIDAGEIIVAVFTVTSTTSAPGLAAAVSSAAGLLNPSTSANVTTGFKTGSGPPFDLNLIDGTWIARDRFWWCALS